MFLALYSGGSREINEALDLQIVNRVGKKGSITYIPSDSTNAEMSQSFFDEFKRYFGHYGIRRYEYFCHDRPFSAAQTKKAFASDAVYLTGGNTFYFRHSLKRAKLDSVLTAFAKRGGALLGQSAGSIIMTPTIATAVIGPVKDSNDVRLENLKGLGLVEPLFVPHYEPRKRFRAELETFSASMKERLVVAAEDGGGMVFSDGQLSLVGPAHLFAGGALLTSVTS